LTFLAQLLPPVGIVVAFYMCWVGAKEPGGAFQGGTVLAAMWLLVMIAGLTSVPSISQRWLRLLLVGGPAIFRASTIAQLPVPRKITGRRTCSRRNQRWLIEGTLVRPAIITRS